MEIVEPQGTSRKTNAQKNLAKLEERIVALQRADRIKNREQITNLEKKLVVEIQDEKATWHKSRN
ncbi:conserved hypothetical protein [Ricinus communis]|uniref:Uncharacterized protein n=1 Tax=Ricinus communis TaxID=3988 RepID=B9RVF6_RICCO|nr:conserved hypothetical protein [Ricinus communis]